jgi:hypothetical protein
MTHEEEQAWYEGYAAGMKFHMYGNFDAKDNPYMGLNQDHLWQKWEEGFGDAGLDS